MKKLLLTIGLTAVIASSALAQGNFIFSASAGSIWDAWSGTDGVPKRSNTNYVAFLIGTGNSLVGETGGFQNSPTNRVGVNPVLTWNAILNDPNYHLATNSGTGALVVQQGNTLGGVSYNSGAAFTVAGTSAAGGTVTIYVIAWSVLAGANPFAAAAAGAPVGWSSEFTYTYAAGPNPGPAGTPGNMNNLFQFGVQPVPEPTTLALAGLGMASLLVFRRRK